MPQYLIDGYRRDAAAYAPENARVSFIRRTYMHLAVSVAALVGILALMLEGLKTDEGRQFLQSWFSSPVSLLVVLGLFIAGGFLARVMARADMPPAVKYGGLALYTVIEAVFLLPIVFVATTRFGMGIVNQAAVLTFITFGGLTLTGFVPKIALSFL